MAYDKESPLNPKYLEFKNPTDLDISGQVVWMVSILDYDDKIIAADHARTLHDALFILEGLQRIPSRWSVNAEYCAVSYYSFKLEPIPVETYEWYTSLSHNLEEYENVLDTISTPSEVLAYLLQEVSSEDQS